MVAQAHESHDAAVHRLAEKARREGVRIKRDSKGRYWATSVSEPGKLHAITGYTCDCSGFLSHGRCKHHSALLAALGWLPSPPNDPTPETPAQSLPEMGSDITPAPVSIGIPKMGVDSTSAPMRGADSDTIMGIDPRRCPTCNGIGEIQYTRGISRNHHVIDWQACPDCKGRKVAA